MIEEIKAARTAQDTLGGIFEVVAYGLPIGLGSHTQWDEKLDGRLAAAMMSMPSIKGVEIGDGLAQTARRGSTVHDVITYDAERGLVPPDQQRRRHRGRHHQRCPVVVRGAAKPISTLIKPLPSVDLRHARAQTPAHFERSDICVIPAAGVVGEAMVALVLADAFRQKFGGDSIAEIEKNYESYVSTYVLTAPERTSPSVGRACAGQEAGHGVARPTSCWSGSSGSGKIDRRAAAGTAARLALRGHRPGDPARRPVMTVQEIFRRPGRAALPRRSNPRSWPRSAGAPAR